MSEIEVQNGIPAPHRPARLKRIIYPWEAMAVGDSFFVAGRVIEKMAAVVYHRKKKSGHDYTCKTENGGVRVWRIA